MARFIYKKYKVNTSYSYSKQISGWSEMNVRKDSTFYGCVSKTAPPSLNINTGKFYLAQSAATTSSASGLSSYYCATKTGHWEWNSSFTSYYEYANRRNTPDDGLRYTYDVRSHYSVRNTNYSRGSFVEDVIAEDGTYPTNGKSGSYWYVRGAIVLPGVPTNISVSGEFKGGKPLIITWGTGTYADNYQVERRDNDSIWISVGTSNNLSFEDMIPKGVETVAYRIRAYGNTQYSSYVTTPTYEIKNFPEMGLRVNGSLKTGSQGWVKVNGQIRNIEGIWQKVNGVLKEG